MKLILPILLLLLGVGGGVGAGLFLMPQKAEEEQLDMALANPCGPDSGTEHAEAGEAGAATEAPPPGDRDYARLNNQFIVPIVADDRVTSLMVVSLSVEVPLGRTALVFDHEPKLRDSFLRVLFEHANLGGFDGNFTEETKTRSLRDSLRLAAQDALGPEATDVLILELVRQEV